MESYRQGDVLIVRTNGIPETAKILPRDQGRVVLTYGEVTGHAHAILEPECELLAVPDLEDRFLRIMNASGVELVHEEHATVSLPPGDYIVRTQREYTPEAIVRVAD